MAGLWNQSSVIFIHGSSLYSFQFISFDLSNGILNQNYIIFFGSVYICLAGYVYHQLVSAQSLGKHFGLGPYMSFVSSNTNQKKN